MSYSVRLTQEARQELRDAVAWYQERSPGTGRALLVEVGAALARIREAPNLYPRWVYDTKFRRALLREFPFRITFRIVDDSLIRVVAITHTRRDPQRPIVDR